MKDKKKKTNKNKKPDLLAVAIYEAKPNPMFTEEQRQWVRFLKFNKFVECAECGKKTKKCWTALTEFTAQSLESTGIGIKNSGKIHKPLTAVCENHLLGMPQKENHHEPETTCS